MVVACVAKAGRPVQLGGWLLPCVTHSSTESADPALAHSPTASTNRRPAPVRRASGAVHIDTSSTTAWAWFGRYAPTRPTTRSSTVAKNVALSSPAEPCRARSAQC